MAVRNRMCPDARAAAVMRDLHCAHARFVWNLAVEQQSWWRPGRGSAPGNTERQRQLAEARAAEPWLREGSSSVLGRRLGQKAAASGCRVVYVNPRFTSQQCRACGHIASSSRESQAVFRCVSCGHTDHADVNAARNILARGLSPAAGEPVPARARGQAGSRPCKTPAPAGAAGTTWSAA